MAAADIEISLKKQALYKHLCSHCLAAHAAAGGNPQAVAIHPYYRYPCGSVTGWLLVQAQGSEPERLDVEQCNAAETDCPCFAEWAQPLDVTLEMVADGE